MADNITIIKTHYFSVIGHGNFGKEEENKIKAYLDNSEWNNGDRFDGDECGVSHVICVISPLCNEEELTDVITDFGKSSPDCLKVLITPISVKESKEYALLHCAFDNIIFVESNEELHIPAEMFIEVAEGVGIVGVCFSDVVYWLRDNKISILSQYTAENKTESNLLSTELNATGALYNSALSVFFARNDFALHSFSAIECESYSPYQIIIDRLQKEYIKVSVLWGQQRGS